MSEPNEELSPEQRLSKLKEQHQKLLSEKQELLQKVGDGERLKLDLRETRRGRKNLTSERERLRTLIDAKNAARRSELSGEELEDSGSEDDQPERPPERRGSNGNPNPRGRELGAEMAMKTEVTALQLENENLVIQNRKLEQRVQSLVEELASLGNKYQELNSLLLRLDAENQRLAQTVNEQHAGQRGAADSVSPEEVEILKAQVRTYEEDFNAERTEREETHAQKERLKLELSEAKAAIRGYQVQLRELSSRQYIFRPYDEVLSRRDPYYGPSYLDRDRRNYGMTRSYSGGYIGPSARDLGARGTKPKRAFLTPDVTAVVDQDVPDSSRPGSCQSI